MNGKDIKEVLQAIFIAIIIVSPLSLLLFIKPTPKPIIHSEPYNICEDLQNKIDNAKYYVERTSYLEELQVEVLRGKCK